MFSGNRGRFRAKDSAFSSPLSLSTKTKVCASVWWKGNFPKCSLTPLATAILSLPTSAAATERNWSVRGAIHTKSRNRLKTDRTTKLCYIKHNLVLLEKSTERPTAQQQHADEDIEVIDEDSETIDDPFGDRDISYDSDSESDSEMLEV